MSADLNKKKTAAALKYDEQNDAAPVAVAIGEGRLAEKIIEQAHEHDVPVVEDPSLALALSKLGVGDEIPIELYAVVAQVLIFVHNVDNDYAKRIHKASEMRDSGGRR